MSAGMWALVVLVAFAWIVALISAPGWTIAFTFVAFLVAAFLTSSGDGSHGGWGGWGGY